MSLSDDELAALGSPSGLRTLTDARLMAALCMGCNDALAVLFERHSALAFGVARSIVRDDGEAEEVVQRVFLEVFRAANQFNAERGSFTTWLLQYVYHRSIDRKAHLRNNRVYNHEQLFDEIPAEQFHGAGRRLWLPPQELACLVEQVLAKLKPHVREVVELTYFEGLTAEEIARKTGATAPSVRNNLYRGLSKLRSVLLESGTDSVTARNKRKASSKGMLVEYPRIL